MLQDLSKETAPRAHIEHNPSSKNLPAYTNQYEAAPQMSGNVLIVEDDPDMREVLSRAISFLDYEIRTAGNGEEALVLIGEQMPDLILLDLMMPEMNGFQVLNCLQRSPETRSIPVFVVSAAEQQPVLKLPGVSYVFPKGQFRLQDLLTAAKHIVETPTTKVLNPNKDASSISPNTLLNENGQSSTWLLRIELASDSCENFEVVLRDEVVLGTISDPGTVDLRPYQAKENGVSRQHVKLCVIDSALSVVDLGSTNGTEVNGQPLKQDIPYPLTSGDTVKLGSLEFVVRVIRAPDKRAYAQHQKADLSDILEQMVTAITSQLEVDAVLDQALRMAISFTSAREATIWLVDEKSGELFLEAERGIEDDSIRRIRISVEDTLAGKVLKAGKSLRANRKPEEDLIKVNTGYLVEALLYVPLTYGETVFGVLSVAHHEPEKAFSPRDEKLLEAIAKFAAIALNNARLFEEVQLANRIKAEMIQNVSHEVRTPLQFIAGYAGLLLDGGESLTTTQREYLEIMAEQADRLTWLMMNFMALQNVSDYALHHQQIELEQFLSESVRDAQLDATEKQVSLSLDVQEKLPPVIANPVAVSQIIDNLLSNALKFTPEGGEVVVKAGLEPSGEKVWVSVVDTGIGIPEEAQERIFERFFQFDGGVTRHYGGVGLGLAVCKEIIDAYGESIWVESAPEQGSTFTFTLSVAS
jgi:signal transduction histidine kinase/pSer/pThr/pTyr-binding forkhead associated (FHA) protein